MANTRSRTAREGYDCRDLFVDCISQKLGCFVDCKSQNPLQNYNFLMIYANISTEKEFANSFFCKF